MRKTNDVVMLPKRERRDATYDEMRKCERCFGTIPLERQMNALYVCRIPKYCSDLCERRAANARYYINVRRQRYRNAKTLTALRAKRRKKKSTMTKQSDV
jgi:hypothetical protein